MVQVGNADIAIWHKYPNFEKHEFAPVVDPGCFWNMHDEVVSFLQNLRNVANRSMPNARVVVHKNGGFAMTGHSSSSLHAGLSRAGWEGEGIVDWEYYDLTGCRIGRAVDFHVGAITVGLDGKVKWKRLDWLQSYLLIHSTLCETLRDHNSFDWPIGLGVYDWGFHFDWREGDSSRTPACWYQVDDGKYKNFEIKNIHKCLLEFSKRS